MNKMLQKWNEGQSGIEGICAYPEAIPDGNGDQTKFSVYEN